MNFLKKILKDFIEDFFKNILGIFFIK